MSWQVETSELPPCHRCTGDLYLMLRTRDDRGLRLVPLCPRCDAGDRNSQALLAFFAFHSRADVDAADDLAALVREWMVGLPPRSAGAEVADEDIEAYYRGDLD